MNDFLTMYVQTKAWMAGTDPYSQTSRLAVWPKEVYGHESVTFDYLTQRAGMPTPYPVFTFVVLVPIALLSWPIASASLVVLEFLMFYVVLQTLASISGMTGGRRIVWIAGAFLFEPFYNGMSLNNAGVLAAECGILAFGAATASRHKLAACLLAVSLAVKPQIGFCFLLYFLLRRFWRIAVPAMIMLGAATTVALLRMQWAHLHWLSNYLQDSAAFFAVGGVNDFHPQNLHRFDLINLQLVFYSLLGNAKVSQIVALLLCGVLLIIWLVYFYRSAGSSNELLLLSCLSAISLLPIYHRFYDATLLLLPFCWYVAHFCVSKLSHQLSLLLWAPFCVFFAVPFRSWIERDHSQNWWLDVFIRPNANWCLLLLTLFLLLNLHHSTRQGEYGHV